jgi:ParB-like chromosome segregation protein Spo0J
VIDRGYARDWAELVTVAWVNPDPVEVYNEVEDTDESRSTAILLDAMLAEAQKSASERALDRLRMAFAGTRKTQAEVADRLGTSRTRLNSYLPGNVTPPVDVLVAVEELASERRAPSSAAMPVPR